jgi:hypothetical protein
MAGIGTHHKKYKANKSTRRHVMLEESILSFLDQTMGIQDQCQKLGAQGYYSLYGWRQWGVDIEDTKENLEI